MSTGSIRPDRSKHMTEVSRSESTRDSSSSSSSFLLLVRSGCDGRGNEEELLGNHIMVADLSKLRLKSQELGSEWNVLERSWLSELRQHYVWRSMWSTIGDLQVSTKWMSFGNGGWSSMFCVKHRFSSMISFTDDVALFIDVITWFHRWFFPFGTRWVGLKDSGAVLLLVWAMFLWDWFYLKEKVLCIDSLRIH